MSRIETTFENLKTENKKALITFVMAGDPDVEKTLNVLSALPDSGADLIEIGMPFTDPMADGPAIQDAGLRALESGTDLNAVIALVKKFRENNAVTPIILMGYFNPIYKYGCEAFSKDAAKAGADGLIIVDLPPEEDAELRVPAQTAGLDFIKLLTPTTKGGRLDKVLQNASGFLYYVSIAGVTGTKSANIEEVGTHIADIKGKTNLPVAVGFGIKTPDNAANMSKIADAVVVGSAIVENIKENQSSSDLSDIISTQVRALKQAI